jgi:tRNA threonylcarbamoyladenosine biosynthesis protein TsaE
MIELETTSPEATRTLGIRLGEQLNTGDIILLDGTLGAGKTHLTQGIAKGLGITGAVRSPTFTLINEYTEGRIPLYHIDLYRTEGNADLATIGLEEYLEGEGVVVIEWSAKGVAWLPTDALHITITPMDDTRRHFHFEAEGERADTLLTELNTVLEGERRAESEA